MLILFWIIDELSFDKYHEAYSRIYRVETSYKMGEREDGGTSTTPPLANALQSEIPEIEIATRITGKYQELISNIENDTNLLIENLHYADANIFDLFTIPLLKGNPNDLLQRRRTLVLTKTLAAKLFGSDDPLGKTLNFSGRSDYEVVGIVADCPANSHLQYEVLASLVSLRSASDTNWLSNNLSTYIKVQEGSKSEMLEEKINTLFQQKADPLFQQAMGMTIYEWQDQGNYYLLSTNPLANIHLYGNKKSSEENGGDIRYIYLFAAIGFFILLIACINFMNLTTAKSAVRAKEIGVRKVLGSRRKQLVSQFLTESILLSFVAMALSSLLIELLLPHFNNFTDKEMSMNFLGIFTIPAFILLTLLIGVMAGGYSAFTLSNFQPLSILKGNLFNQKQKSGFRNTLVLFQFTISIVVIICTLVSLNQIKYMSKKKLGFDKEHLLVLDRAYTMGEKLGTFKEEILKSSEIVSVSTALNIPGSSSDGSMFQKENSTPNDLLRFYRICSDADYLKTMNIKLKSGRYFSGNSDADKSSVVINETAVEKLGYKNPLGRKIIEPGSEIDLTIIGVVEDFHNNSLHDEISPIMMYHPTLFTQQYLVVRLGKGDISRQIDFMEKSWEDFSENQPFSYFFMDSYFDNLHRKEQIIGKFFTAFAFLAIFISCLGLFGLAAFTAQQKRKEIGVRKVLGASTGSIVQILFSQFTRWVLLANFAAWPLGYFLMKSWLQNFAYHIDLHLSYFIFAGILTLFISLITVSFQAVKAASRNPIEALMHE